MTKNILIIPSWYPTKENKIQGSFFKEQANLFCNDYDVKVLYGISKRYSLIRFPLAFISKILKQNFDIAEKYTNPNGISFFILQVFIYGFIKKCIPLYRLLEKFNLKLIIKRYGKKIELWKKDGWEPDIIHAQSVFEGGVYAYYLAKRYKIPFLITEHQPYILNNFSEYKRNLYKTALEKANKVIAVSNHQKRSILQNGVECNPVVIGNYIDETRFKMLEKVNKSEIINLLSVMYAEQIKDYKTLFKGINYIHEKGYTNFKIIIIGGNYENLSENNPKNPFYKEIKKYKLEKHVVLINSVPRDKMPEYYRNSDVFISTSIAETFGVSMCEALICGKPVISSKNGGSDDFLNSNNSLIFNIGDYKSLGEAIIIILDKKKQFNSQQMRAGIIKEYGNEAFFKNLNNIYKSVL